MTTSDTPEVENERAGVREWLGLATLTLPLLLLALDVSVLYLAAPQLSADLDPSATQQLWILDIYGFFIAGFLVTMGTLGDRIGRRKLLLIGGGAFAAASLMAAYAPTAELLIVARALLGIAGATLMPSTLALLRNLFRDPAQRSFAIAVWMATFMAGAALGPVVGGFMLEHFWWGSVFLLGVPVMVLLLIFGPLLLPEYADPNAGKVDLLSVALSLMAMLPLVYGVKRLVGDGFELVSLAAVGFGLLAGVVFVRRQRRLPNPLLDLSLFANKAFTGVLLILLVVVIAQNGTFYLVPQFLQMVSELSALQAAVWMIPMAAVPAIGAVIVPRFARRIAHSTLIIASAVLAAVGFGLVALISPGTGPGWLVAAAIVALLGTSVIGVLATDLVIGSVPQQRTGTAAALNETSSELGVGLGVAVMGSVVAAVYRAGMVDTAPSALPDGAEEASADSLVGALGAAVDLPPHLAESLLSAGRQAFTNGFGVAASISAGLLVVVGLLMLRVRRHLSSPTP
ncbi:MFS transporter [Prauserella marina]|uniref:MFS transporter, DHA2 family, multidrug resistance protein n=1 Tax=Prauserella marina TaxID=530584 RepID=A0A222VXK3_9PSEU|nr:MFS transporter [Prauserella marina]ASR38552.1 MFS transporter [Prauserella marina]PWV81862.1 DHA2 family multidrug resistance protein-like MFS transporter [Prauserella marina]SDD14066.1 MFS transporter, DHA2 family, multidrug resistance protein [Prauserella marina]